MYCFHPIVVRQKGVEREVPCGKCPACRRAYQLQWIIRLKEELKHSESGYFVTLTQEGDEVTFDKKRCQLFLNRLQHKAKYHGAHLKYFFVSEFGDTTGRPHYHALFFLDKYLDNFSQFIADGWPFGFISVGDITGARINYVTAYCLKKQQHGIDWSDLPDELNPDKCKFISKGLGLGYLSDNIRQYHKNGLVMRYQSPNGIAQLPRYYRDKIFDEDDLEQIKLTNRCYVKSAENKILRPLGLKRVTMYDTNKCCFYKTIVPISSETPITNLVEHYRINQKKKMRCLKDGVGQSIDQINNYEYIYEKFNSEA